MAEKQMNPEEYILKIIYQQIESKLKVILDWRAHYIMNRFQQFFNQDSQQVPRHWQNYTSDHIKDIYLEAREKSLGRKFFFVEPPIISFDAISYSLYFLGYGKC
jgi:hypothetical protein